MFPTHGLHVVDQKWRTITLSASVSFVTSSPETVVATNFGAGCARFEICYSARNDFHVLSNCLDGISLRAKTDSGTPLANQFLVEFRQRLILIGSYALIPAAVDPANWSLLYLPVVLLRERKKDQIARKQPNK
jgi:hypothetical protein